MTPFILAHELIHAKYDDKQRYCDNDILSCEEKRANKECIILLWEIYKEQGGNSSYFSNFIEIAGCPFEESITILRKLEAKDENTEEINPCFNGNLKECAIHYISGFDVMSSIKVYDFLELYNLSYNLYDEAVREFQEFSDQQNLAY